MDKDSHINIAADRYTIEEEIGRGGMGVVLKAHDHMLNIPVAIKILGKDPTGERAVRLQREAQAAGRLSHPNIARILDFGRTPDSTPYMVMEYLEGTSLSDLIKQKLPDCKKAVPIFAQLAAALNYAHSNGVVHRDLKPSNVVLIELDASCHQAKLLDFGVARLFNEDLGLTKTGVVVGSPLYMSPEVACGDEATPLSDVYSFGCLMFETLTGEVPFKGASALETISMHRNNAPPLLTDLIPVQKLPRELVELIDECLRKNPAARPVDFKIIHDKLKTIQEKIDSKGLTPELIQRISNQHFKIRIYQFWKSKFGAIGMVSAIIALVGLGVSIFNSEQKRISENKAVSKHNVIENPLIQDNHITPNEGVTGKGFDYSYTKDGVIVSTDNSVDDGELVRLKNKVIVEAHLDHGIFDGSGLKYINPKHLISLSIKSRDIKEENLKYISSMKSLDMLRIDSPSLSDSGLKFIAPLHSLHTLNLSSNRITPNGVLCLETLPHLRDLGIKSSGITDDIYKSLVKLKELRFLYLKDSSLSKDIGVKLSKLKSLELLDLSGTKEISDKSFEELSKTKVAELFISNTVLSDTAMQNIAKIKSLSSLSLGNSRFNTESLKYLKDLPRLHRIDFSESENISDELIRNLIEMKELRTIIFNQTNITDAQFLKLTTMRNLNRVETYETNVSDETYQLFHETFERIWKRNCEAQGSLSD